MTKHVSDDRAARIDTALRAAFAPTHLEIVDDSARHAGHAGAAAGGQTHYNVLIVSAAFRGQNRVVRSRAVHAVLADELGSGLHALALTLRTPEEMTPEVAPNPASAGISSR
jgi:BolA protein